MIKKLKIRFVLVNMLILSLVLFATLSGIYVLMFNSEINMSEEIMDTLIENHKKNMPHDRMPDRTPDITQYSLSGTGLYNPEKMSHATPLFYDADSNIYENLEAGYNNHNDNFDWDAWNKYWQDYWAYSGGWNPQPDDAFSGVPPFIPPKYPPYDPDWKPEFPQITEMTNTQPDTTTVEPPEQTTHHSEQKQQYTQIVTQSPPENLKGPDVSEVPAIADVPDNTDSVESTLDSDHEQTTAVTSVTSSSSLSAPVTTTPVYTKSSLPKPETTKYNGNLVRSHIFIRLSPDKKEILDISYQYFFQYNTDDTKSDYDVKIRNAIENIVKSGDRSGKYKIDSVAYRYKFNNSPDQKECFLIILDRSIEISTLNRLMIIFIIIGCIGLVIVFFISIFLANWAIKPIEIAWNKQKQFIADASHELKTPLTVISTNTDVVLSNPYDSIKSQERWLKYIKAETLRMSKLVNELLYIAKSDTNQIKMEMSEFNISNTISSICLVFEPMVFEAGKTLVSDISSRLKFYGDEDRIKQLVTILLDNSVKYSLINSQISVSLFQNNQGKIKFCISNKCEELSDENILKLFDRFYRVDDSRNSKTGGNGLGLNIAQTIAMQHNGTITVQYNYGMISFIVTL